MERRFDLERNLTRRERAVLRRAREQGWLDAGRAGSALLIRAYGRWCWRLRIPTVWMERRSRCSRYCRVHLDMFTTAHVLTAAGCAELEAVAAQCTASAHDACVDWAPVAEASDIARLVFRAATRKGNYAVVRVAGAGIRAATA